MNCCSWRAPLVMLIDGRQVPSDGEEWRHECEARAVLAMPTVWMRRQYLRGKLNDFGRLEGGVLQKRGEEATKRLEATITAIWNASRDR